MGEMRYLLLQIRTSADAMREQEVRCFAEAIGCELSAIRPFDLLAGVPGPDDLGGIGAILIGGSGDYSAAGDNPWLSRTLDGLRRLVDEQRPIFASCWGFQALARALGGRCIYDPQHAELGTLTFSLTAAGGEDPLFSPLGESFAAQAGHEDHVVELPPGAVLLASSELVPHQAFKLEGMPVYCTQFHPELDLESFLERVAAYPQYVERIAKVPADQFARQCRETPAARLLLRRFVDLVV